MKDWYLASALRGGTHFGRLENDGTVQAACGEVFTPQADLFGGGEVAVAMLPMSAEQACRGCCQRAGVPVEDVEAPRPNSVRRDLRQPLGTWVRRSPGASLPPAPAAPVVAAPPHAPPAASSAGKSWWLERSAKPGDTHWVVTTRRGTKITACELSFQQGRKMKDPAPDRICPACAAKRPR